MNAHMSNFGSKSNGPLLSPPSSPEMDQHYWIFGNGRLPNAQERQDVPLRDTRLKLCDPFRRESTWALQPRAEASGHQIPPALQDYRDVVVQGLPSETEPSRQPTWSTMSASEVGFKPDLMTRSDLGDPAASHKHSMSSGDLYHSPLLIEGSRPPPNAEPRNEGDDDDLISSPSDEDEGPSVGDEMSVTATERHAETRKMKRFR